MGVSVRSLAALVFVLATVPAVSGLLCYWCSGVGSDRECELHPNTVSTGPVFINCREKHCVSTKVIDIASGKVTSFARFCDRASRGNICVRDSRLITCYESCKDDLCNHGNPDPAYLPLVSYAGFDVIARYSEHRIPGKTGGVLGNRVQSAVAARKKLHRVGWWKSAQDEYAEVNASTTTRALQRPQLWKEEEGEEEKDGGNALNIAAKSSPKERVSGRFDPEENFHRRNAFGEGPNPRAEERSGRRSNTVLVEEDAEEGRGPTGERTPDSRYRSPYRPPRKWESKSRRRYKPTSRSLEKSLSAGRNPGDRRSFPSTTMRLATASQRFDSRRRDRGDDDGPAVNSAQRSDGTRQQESRQGGKSEVREQIRRMMTKKPFTAGKKRQRAKVAASYRKSERVEAPKVKVNAPQKPVSTTKKVAASYRKSERVEAPKVKVNAPQKPASTTKKVAASYRKSERVEAPKVKVNAPQKPVSTTKKVAASYRKQERVEAPKVKVNAPQKPVSTTKKNSTRRQRTRPPVLPAKSATIANFRDITSTSSLVSTTDIFVDVPTIAAKEAIAASAMTFTTFSSNMKTSRSPATTSGEVTARAGIAVKLSSSKTNLTAGGSKKSPFSPPQSSNHRYRPVHKMTPKQRHTSRTPGMSADRQSTTAEQKILSTPPSRARDSRGKPRRAFSSPTAEWRTTAYLTSPNTPSTGNVLTPAGQNAVKPKFSTRPVHTAVTGPGGRKILSTRSTIPTTTLFPVLHGFDIKGPDEYEQLARLKPWVRPLFSDLGSMLAQKPLSMGGNEDDVDANLPNSPAGKSGFGGHASKKALRKPPQSIQISTEALDRVKEGDSFVTSSQPFQAGSTLDTTLGDVDRTSRTLTSQPRGKSESVQTATTTAQTRLRGLTTTSGHLRARQGIRSHAFELTRRPPIFPRPEHSRTNSKDAGAGLELKKDLVDRDLVQKSKQGRGGEDVKDANPDGDQVRKHTIDYQFYRKDLLKKPGNGSAPLKRLQSHRAPETGVWYSGYSSTMRNSGWTAESESIEEPTSSTRTGFFGSESAESTTAVNSVEKSATAKGKDTLVTKRRRNYFSSSDSSIITHPVRKIYTTPIQSVSPITVATSTKPFAIQKKNAAKGNKRKNPKVKNTRVTAKSRQATKHSSNLDSRRNMQKIKPSQVKGNTEKNGVKKSEGQTNTRKINHRKPVNMKTSSSSNAKKSTKPPPKPGKHYKRPRKIATIGNKRKTQAPLTSTTKQTTTTKSSSLEGSKLKSRKTPRLRGDVHDKNFFHTTAGTAYSPRGPGRSRNKQPRARPVHHASNRKIQGNEATSKKPTVATQLKASKKDKGTTKKAGKSPYNRPKGTSVDQRQGAKNTLKKSSPEAVTRPGSVKSTTRTSSETGKTSSSTSSGKVSSLTSGGKMSTTTAKNSKREDTQSKSVVMKKYRNNKIPSDGETKTSSRSTATKKLGKNAQNKTRKAQQSPYTRPSWTENYDFTISGTKQVTKPTPKRSSSSLSWRTLTTTTERKGLSAVTAIHVSSPVPKTKLDKQMHQPTSRAFRVTSPTSRKAHWQRRQTTTEPKRVVSLTSRAPFTSPYLRPKLPSSKQRSKVGLERLHDDERQEVLGLIPSLKDDAIIWPREPKDVEERIISKVIMEEDAEEVLHQALPRKALMDIDAEDGESLEEDPDLWAPNSQSLSGALEGEMDEGGGNGEGDSNSASVESSNGRPPLFTGTINSTLDSDYPGNDHSAEGTYENSFFTFNSASPLQFLWSLFVSTVAVFFML